MPWFCMFLTVLSYISIALFCFIHSFYFVDELCGNHKKSRTDFISVLLYFFWSFVAWEMLHFSLSQMNRLNKTGSAIFILYFGLVPIEGSTFTRIFHVHNVEFYMKPDTMSIINVFGVFLHIKLWIAYESTYASG